MKRAGKSIMKLTAARLKELDKQGYLFFPNCFSEEEIVLLTFPSPTMRSLPMRARIRLRQNSLAK